MTPRPSSLQGAQTAPRLERTAQPAPAEEHAFYIGAAVIALVIVGVGFGHSLAGAAVRPRNTLVLAHASVFATWIILFAVQTSLVASGRTRLHRSLGIVGAALALLMLALGSATAIQGARTGYAPAPGTDALTFLIVPLGDLIVFAPLVVAALYWRRSPAVHKRLMWLATVTLLFPAVTRLPLAQTNIAVMMSCFILLLLLAPLYEFVVRRRVHPVVSWGGVAVFSSVAVRLPIGQTDSWRAFAAWLIR